MTFSFKAREAVVEKYVARYPDIQKGYTVGRFLNARV